LQLLGGGAVDGTDRCVASLAIGQGDDHVADAGVAIDRDPVEGLIDGRFQQGREDIVLNRTVGRQDADHGGHIGVDHAGALGHASDGDCLAFELERHDTFLGHEIRGHDRLLSPVTGILR